jgi:hypothetical protein
VICVKNQIWTSGSRRFQGTFKCPEWEVKKTNTLFFHLQESHTKDTFGLGEKRDAVKNIWFILYCRVAKAICTVSTIKLNICRTRDISVEHATDNSNFSLLPPDRRALTSSLIRSLLHKKKPNFSIIDRKDKVPDFT